MQRLSFESDYTEGAHQAVLNRLIETNMEALSGYGSDRYCASAREKIRTACQCEDAAVHFLVGGTQTNQIVISSLLQSYEGVVAAVSGHIATHEAGAIEVTGHKVLTLPEHEGKIDADELWDYLDTFKNDANHDHMVFPGMVYISHPTEYGTLYTKEELESISKVCASFDIPLYLDGARLGYGLAADTDVTLPVIAKCCDVFYIGGTKVGALCGEAVVFTKKEPKHFITIVKQRGALLAKGRLLGVQFDTLFTDDLYFKMGQHAINMAKLLVEIFEEKGYRFYLKSPTNQQFIILENTKLKELEEKVAFSFWEKYDDEHTVVRFATSWATSLKNVEMLKNLL